MYGDLKLMCIILIMTKKHFGRVKLKLIERLSDGDENWLINLSNAYSNNEEHARRILSYFNHAWFFVSSPVAANVPVSGKGFTGLPISCYLISVGNDKSHWNSIIKECEYISHHSGGIGIDFSEYLHEDVLDRIRELGTIVNEIKSKARYKSSLAAYLSISHSCIEDFISLRDPKLHAEPKRFIHHGVIISDDFMNACMENKDWNLIGENGRVVKTVSARNLLTKIMTTRSQTGEPYIFYIDNANKVQPLCYKKLGLLVKTSNLCTEITLPTQANVLTAICCLCSLNILKSPEWTKDSNFIRDVMMFMDNVLTYFIICGPLLVNNDVMNYDGKFIAKSLKNFESAFMKYIDYDPIKNIGEAIDEDVSDIRLNLFNRIHAGEISNDMLKDFKKCIKAHPMRKAFIAAILGRDIGIGQCGMSTLLQTLNINIESDEAYAYMEKVEKHIKTSIDKVNEELANEIGACCAGVQTDIDCRFVNTTAIAPTTMISQFCECSACVEIQDPVCRIKTGYDVCTYYNPVLKDILIKHHKDDIDVWSQLSSGNLSVLNGIVSDPNVFKGPYSVDHVKYIKLCGMIGQYISQAISLNLFYFNDVTISEMIKHAILVWKLGLKSMYYLRSKPAMSISSGMEVCVGCQ